MISKDAKTINDLNKTQLRLYERTVQEYYDLYTITWKTVLLKSIQYKKPFIVNAGLDKVGYGTGNEPSLYVFATFLRSGQHYYSVQDRKGDEPVNYVHSMIANFRNEEIALYEKLTISTMHERVFKKETSVFQKWIPDSNKNFQKCLECDQVIWKVSKFVKDENDLENVEKLVLEHYQVLKDNYVFIASGSNFPGISSNEMTLYFKKFNIIDANLQQADIDRLFISANVSLEGNKDHGNFLMRYEFIELMIRVANEKCKRMKLTETVAESFKILIE